MLDNFLSGSLAAHLSRNRPSRDPWHGKHKKPTIIRRAQPNRPRVVRYATHTQVLELNHLPALPAPEPVMALLPAAPPPQMAIVDVVANAIQAQQAAQPHPFVWNPQNAIAVVAPAEIAAPDETDVLLPVLVTEIVDVGDGWDAEVNFQDNRSQVKETRRGKDIPDGPDWTPHIVGYFPKVWMDVTIQSPIAMEQGEWLNRLYFAAFCIDAEVKTVSFPISQRFTGLSRTAKVRFEVMENRNRNKDRSNYAVHHLFDHTRADATKQHYAKQLPFHLGEGTRIKKIRLTQQTISQAALSMRQPRTKWKTFLFWLGIDSK